MDRMTSMCWTDGCLLGDAEGIPAPSGAPTSLETPMRVIAFDPLVLNVADIARSLAFYTGPLGLERVRGGGWRAGTVSFPSVRVSPTTIIDLVQAPDGRPEGSNVDHICP